jgi:hypothetical protein
MQPGIGMKRNGNKIDGLSARLFGFQQRNALFGERKTKMVMIELSDSHDGLHAPLVRLKHRHYSPK